MTSEQDTSISDNVHRTQEPADGRSIDYDELFVYTPDEESIGTLTVGAYEDNTIMGNYSYRIGLVEVQGASIQDEGNRIAPEEQTLQERRERRLSVRWLIVVTFGLCVFAIVALSVAVAKRTKGTTQSPPSQVAPNESASTANVLGEFPSIDNASVEPITTPSLGSGVPGTNDSMTSTPMPTPNNGTNLSPGNPVDEDLMIISTAGPLSTPTTQPGIAPTESPITQAPGANTSPTEPDEELLVYEVDDFTVGTPYQGIVTTPLDPYEPEDCYYGDNIQPHVLNQCECFQKVSIIANDTKQLYFDIRADISEEVYGGNYNEPIDSCDPVNQALVWLSSGNTRDAGDLYQRFVAALTFIQMNGTGWDQKQLWLSDESECMWFGLLCNDRFQVNYLNLDTNNVHGSIPTEISYIDTLKSLSLTRNHLSGTIPTEIFTMPNLENLVLYTNQLIGSIPQEIGKATKLKTIQLENNLMFGTIATEIGQATALEELSIGFNEFWRRLPTELGLLTNMKILRLEENRISGTIPTEMGQMSLLEYLLLSKNIMTGPIPVEFQRMSELRELRLADAGIGGTFPKELAILTNMRHLDVGSNTFKGTIMTEFGSMTNLEVLSMKDNDLIGTIPTELGYLLLAQLILNDCFLSGTIPTQLGSMTTLEKLSVEGNLLTGAAPPEVCFLRNLELTMFVTDCKTEKGGVSCPDDCCTFCRRNESAPAQPLAAKPTAPTKSPTRLPTPSSTISPSISPSMPSTISPVRSPSVSPSISPARFPLVLPSTSPSESLTASPARSQSMSPSALPSISPTASLSRSPSTSPSASPSTSPSASPSASPSVSPSVSPSASLAKRSTISPTQSQTNSTGSPTSVQLTSQKPVADTPQPSSVYNPPPTSAQPALQPPAPTPKSSVSNNFDPLYINSGSEEKILSTENGKKKWVPDIQSSPRYRQFGQSMTSNKACERNEEDRLLCSERWYPVEGGYAIPAPKGKKYMIIMYFEEVIHEDPNFQRRFKIFVQDFMVRREYDIMEEAEGPNKLTTVKWVIEDLQQDEINIRFETIKGKDHAKISAVEIFLCAPFDCP